MIDKNIALNKKLDARIKELEKQIAKLEKRDEELSSFIEQNQDKGYVVQSVLKQIPGVRVYEIAKLMDDAFDSHCNRIKELDGKEPTWGNGETESFLDKDLDVANLYSKSEESEIY